MALPADFKQWLCQNIAGKVKFDDPLARHTSFKIGGPADAVIRVKDIGALKNLIQWCSRQRLNYFVMGDGTNLLFSDAGFRGIVISLMGDSSSIQVFPSSAGRVMLKVPAGVRTASFCRYAANCGLDANFALGIPGTVGGAVSMNAGTHLGSFQDVVHGLTVMLSNGELCYLNRSNLNFTYRQLTLNSRQVKDKAPIIIEIEMVFTKGDAETITTTAQKLLAQRHESQPTGSSAGCFFKNPPQANPAGWLIDRAGLRGHRRGGAQISEKHANFIINCGSATADDVLDLMRLAQEAVNKQFGIILEPEVKIIHE